MQINRVLTKDCFFFFFSFFPGLRNLCLEALPHRFKKVPLGLQAAVDLLLSLSSPHRRTETTNIFLIFCAWSFYLLTGSKPWPRL